MIENLEQKDYMRQIMVSNVMIDKEIIDITVCPKCKGKLIYENDKLICSVCNLQFKIINGIPDMILDHAEKT